MFRLEKWKCFSLVSVFENAGFKTCFGVFLGLKVTPAKTVSEAPAASGLLVIV